MKVIALSGKMRCGKTTLAQMIAKYLPNAYRVSFGDEVRREVARGMGFGENWQNLLHVKKNDIRPVLQAWGHNMRKIRGEDVWIKSLFSRLVNMTMHDPNRIFVIDDVRYRNEAEHIYNYEDDHILGYKAHTIRLICGRETQIRRGADPLYLDHSSETQLDLDSAFRWDSHFDSNEDDFHNLFFDVLKELRIAGIIGESQSEKAWARYLSDSKVVPTKALHEYGE